jgi:hypothetical protein
MAHPYFHSLSSVRHWGGSPDDYIKYHAWFDESKKILADARHRLALHHDAGIQLFVSLFEGIIPNEVPARDLGEQHVYEDFGEIVAIDEVARRLRKYHRLSNHEPCAKALVKQYGGTVDDYASLYEFFTQYLQTTSQLASVSLLANAFGIFIAEQKFGALYNLKSTGRTLPLRAVAESMVSTFYGEIPSLQDVLSEVPVERWMFKNAAALSKQFNGGYSGGVQIEETAMNHLGRKD